MMNSGLDRRMFLTGVAGLTGAALLGKGQEAVAQDTPAAASKPASTMPAGVGVNRTHIGNLQALMPGGIAFVRNDEFGIVLDIGWDATNRPGIAAPDNSINRIVFKQDAATIHFDWGRKRGADCVLIRLVADVDATLTLKLPARPWHAFSTIITVPDERTVDAICLGFRGAQLPWKLLSDTPLARVGEALAMAATASFTLKLAGGKAACLCAGFGELPPVQSVGAALDAAAATYDSSRARVAGPWGDFAAPIADNLNNSRMYSNICREVVHGIGRERWIIRRDPDYLPLFGWDTSFNALLASLEDPEQAKITLRTLLSYQQPNGMVPQIANWMLDPIPSINLRGSNPPVASMCAWKLYERWPDRKFLEEIYPKLLRYHDWWPKFSDGNGNGLLEWGAVGTYGDCLLMSGWDDTVAFNGGKKIGTQLNIDAVDLNSLWSMDAEHLAKMADVLGLRADAARLREDQRRVNQLMNERLWNEELGLYCHRLWDEDGKPGNFLTRLTPMNFYPLMCGAPDEGRAKRMLGVLTDPKRFWGEWPIPTVEYSDREWPRQGYWRGHVWAPVNYLIWLGLKRYGMQQPMRELAERSVQLFMRNWTDKGTCNENYKSSDGSGDDIPHYTWGALLCQIGIEHLCEPSHTGALTLTEAARSMKSITLKNIPSGGARYDVILEGGQLVVRKS